MSNVSTKYAFDIQESPVEIWGITDVSRYLTSRRRSLKTMTLKKEA
jgi:hypothetical protein